MEISNHRAEGHPVELAGILPKLIRDTGCGDWQVTRKPLQRKDCTIYFLSSGTYGISKAVLKIFRKNAVGRNYAKNLHKTGRRYHAAATARFGVPEPITFFEEENAMLMEYIDAPSCGSVLMKGFYSRHRRQGIIRHAAAWLKWFHAQSGVTMERFDAVSFVMKLRNTFENLSAGEPSRDEFLARCITRAEAIASGMNGVLIPHAAVHADFTPYNLFIQGERMIGFDFRPNRRCPVAHDIGRFLIYLDVYRIIPARSAEQGKYGCRKDDCEVFMDAYGWDSGDLDEALWLRLQFLLVVKRIISLTRIRAMGRGRMNPFRLIESTYLRRNARNMLGSLG